MDEREVAIDPQLLVELFRVGNVLQEQVADVTQGIPDDAKLEQVFIDTQGRVVLRLDRPSPTPMLRLRVIGHLPQSPNGTAKP